LVATASPSPGAAPSVTDGSWFWSQQPDPLPQAGYQQLPHPDVPAGDFAAAVRAGTSDKETYLHIDTSDWVDGTTVTKFVLTVKEDTAASGNIDPAGADGKIRALGVVEYFAGSTEGGPYSQKPSTTKSDAADGKRSTDGTWTFDLTAIASKWASGTMQNYGIGLVPNVAASDSYQVVWQGASTMTIDAEVSPPASSTSGSDNFPVFGATSPSDTTPVTLAPSTGGTFTPPVSTDTTPTTATPATTTPPAAAAAPVTRRVALKSKHGLPWTFALVVLFILALAAAGAIALGDLGEPTAPRRGSVLRRLERSYE
jgi:hypothetical protein